MHVLHVGGHRLEGFVRGKPVHHEAARVKVDGQGTFGQGLNQAGEGGPAFAARACRQHGPAVLPVATDVGQRLEHHVRGSFFGPLWDIADLIDHNRRPQIVSE